jgi:hypothetical protein
VTCPVGAADTRVGGGTQCTSTGCGDTESPTGLADNARSPHEARRATPAPGSAESKERERTRADADGGGERDGAEAEPVTVAAASLSQGVRSRWIGILQRCCRWPLPRQRRQRTGSLQCSMLWSRERHQKHPTPDRGGGVLRGMGGSGTGGFKAAAR